MRRKNIFVTGATGFVGQNLVPALLKKKYSVHVVTKKKTRMYGQNVTYHTSDLKKEFPHVSIKDTDAIVHLASELDINQSIEMPRNRFEHNMAMTLSVLDAARKSDKKPLIVFASTDRVYGKTKRRIVTEEEPEFPIEPYTASKMTSEIAMATYANLYDIPYITLRFDSIYGPHQPKEMFISDVIHKMIENDHITTGQLSTRKNFVYVDDVVDAIVATLHAPSSAYNKIYNIGGSYSSLKDLLKIIKDIISKKLTKKITTSQDTVVRRPSKTEVNSFSLSTKKAMRLLKWRARTSLKQGLEKTVNHFLNQANNA
jgi:nucleoside-diphosphate-sugar epimerase